LWRPGRPHRRLSQLGSTEKFPQEHPLTPEEAFGTAEKLEGFGSSDCLAAWPQDRKDREPTQPRHIASGLSCRTRIEDGVVTLTDHVGQPVRDREGNTDTQTLAEGEDAYQIAGRLTRKSAMLDAAVT
jgi:hypothetical protein